MIINIGDVRHSLKSVKTNVNVPKWNTIDKRQQTMSQMKELGCVVEQELESQWTWVVEKAGDGKCQFGVYRSNRLLHARRLISGNSLSRTVTIIIRVVCRVISIGLRTICRWKRRRLRRCRRSYIEENGAVERVFSSMVSKTRQVFSRSLGAVSNSSASFVFCINRSRR